MAYSGVKFLFFFLPLTLLAYQVAPQGKRRYVLLAASLIYFYLLSNWLIIYLLGTIAVVYTAGISMELYASKKKILAAAAAGLVIGALAVLKYADFMIGNLNLLTNQEIPLLSLAAPIGISYYTLEAVGYLLEVYWGRVKAERNVCNLALFLAFFPQTMEGPIARYQDTAQQLLEGRSITHNSLFEGSLLILWGLFKKIVIADRLAVMVNSLYGQWDKIAGASILVAGTAFVIQLYFDFSGVIDIIRGVALMFQIELPDNFRQPFFAETASDFWRRWHISLGIWLKTYVFYPMTTSKLVTKWMLFSKKRYGKYIRKAVTSSLVLFPVWLINGIWHGGQWVYLLYGMYYFVILVIEVVLEPVKMKIYQIVGWNPKNWFFRCLRIGRTWIIIFAGELFFNAASVKSGIQLLVNLFNDFKFSDLWGKAVTGVGLDAADFAVILCGTLIVLLYDLLKENNIDVIKLIEQQKLPVRWAICYALIIAVVVFGAYGVGYEPIDPMYASF